MKPEMAHKYNTESKESTTIVTKTKPASSSVCTKVKTTIVPPPVYTETASKPSKSVCTKVKTTSASPSVSTKVETKTVEKPYTKVETVVVEKPYTKTVEKPYTKIETKTVEKQASCTKSQAMSVSTETAYTTLTKTFAVSTCSQAGPTDKPCSCKHKHDGEDDQPCSCKKAEKHHEEEQPEETENKCPGYLSKGFEVCLHHHT
jgi:hypothetical protein